MSYSGKVHAEHSTAVENATTFAGQAGVAVRFNHSSDESSAAILGLTERKALILAVQLIETVLGTEGAKL